MDLKFYHKKLLIHLVDHATRLSVTTVIPSNHPDTIKPSLAVGYKYMGQQRSSLLTMVENLQIINFLRYVS